MVMVESELLSDNSYGAAQVLLFDSHDTARRNTRTALNSLGVWQIREAANPRELRNCLSGGAYDLVLLSSSHLEDGTAAMMRQIRRHAIGEDPFAPLLATVASTDGRLVSEIAYAGVDQIVGRPFSGKQIRRRLDAILSERKGFIETLDYLGPDRRKPGQRPSDVVAIAVPNALKARIERRTDLAPSPERIAAAKAQLADMRRRNIGRRIAATVKSFDRTEGGGETSYEALCRCLDGLMASHGASDQAPVAKQCAGLRRMAAACRDAPAGERDDARRELVAQAGKLLSLLEDTAA